MGLAVTSVTTNLFHMSPLLMNCLYHSSLLFVLLQPWTHFLCLEKGDQGRAQLGYCSGICADICLPLTAALGVGCQHPHFTDQEAEAQTDALPWTRQGHRASEVKMQHLGSGLPDSKTRVPLALAPGIEAPSPLQLEQQIQATSPALWPSVPTNWVSALWDLSSCSASQGEQIGGPRPTPRLLCVGPSRCANCSLGSTPRSDCQAPSLWVAQMGCPWGLPGARWSSQDNQTLLCLSHGKPWFRENIWPGSFHSWGLEQLWSCGQKLGWPSKFQGRSAGSVCR